LENDDFFWGLPEWITTSWVEVRYDTLEITFPEIFTKEINIA